MALGKMKSSMRWGGEAAFGVSVLMIAGLLHAWGVAFGMKAWLWHLGAWEGMPK